MGEGHLDIRAKPSSPPLAHPLPSPTAPTPVVFSVAPSQRSETEEGQAQRGSHLVTRRRSRARGAGHAPHVPRACLVHLFRVWRWRSSVETSAWGHRVRMGHALCCLCESGLSC